MKQSYYQTYKLPKRFFLHIFSQKDTEKYIFNKISKLRKKEDSGFKKQQVKNKRDEGNFQDASNGTPKIMDSLKNSKPRLEKEDQLMENLFGKLIELKIAL